jgi:Flp pilus assembly pilin Flp
MPVAGSAMKMKCIAELLRRLRSDSGQAVTEYALLAFWTVLIILATCKALQLALLDSYQDLASLICLPIP